MLHRLLLSLLLSALTLFPPLSSAPILSDVSFAQSDTVPTQETPPSDVVPPSIDMSIDPASGTLAAGEAINLSLIVASGDQAVVGVQMYIKYDPTRLMPIASDGTPAGAQKADGTTVEPVMPSGPLRDALLNQVNGTDGRIDYAVGSLSTSGTGTFPVGVVRFQSLAGTGDDGTAVQIVNLDPQVSTVVTEQGRAPVNLGATRIVILGDAPSAPAPASADPSAPPADQVPAAE